MVMRDLARAVYRCSSSRTRCTSRDVGDRVVFMDEGKIVEEGIPADVLDHPKMERTQRFLRRSPARALAARPLDRRSGNRS